MKARWLALATLCGVVSCSDGGAGKRADDLRSAGQIQLLSQQIRKFAPESASGKIEAFKQLEAARDAIDTQIKQIEKDRNGEGKELIELKTAWAPLEISAAKILADRGLVLNSSAISADFLGKASKFDELMDKVATILEERNGASTNAAASQVRVASRLMFVLARMIRRVHAIVQGGDEAESAADGLLRDASVYGATLAALSKGNPDRKIKPMENPRAKEILDGVLVQWAGLGESLNQLAKASAALLAMRVSADGVFAESQTVVLRANALELSTPLARDLEAQRLAIQIQSLSVEMSTSAAKIAAGGVESFRDLQGVRDGIEKDVKQLKAAAGASQELAELETAWDALKLRATKILDNKDLLRNSIELVADFSSRAVVLNDSMDQVTKSLSDKNPDALQMAVVCRQMLLIDRIGDSVREILQGGEKARTAAASASHAAQLFTAVLNGLIKGNAELNIKAIDNADAKVILDEVAQEWDKLAAPVHTLLSSAAGLDAVKVASIELLGGIPRFELQAKTLAEKLSAATN